MSNLQDLKPSRPHDLQEVEGVLVVDKTEGPTSHDVVTLARRALGVSRIGHTGTLDPMATGVLPLVIGRATRLAQFLTASDKSYEATLAFGRSTDTYDTSGKVTSESDQRPTRADLDAAVARFRGTFDQTPPAYSAKNIDGERSYELARKHARGAGRDGALAPPAPARPKSVPVTVTRLEILSFDGDTARLEMQVTAGFYVRSLVHDLGDALGCGAVLTALRRTRSGEFGLDRAVPLADVLQRPREELVTRFVGLNALMPDVPAVVLRSVAHIERVKNGVEVAPGDVVTPLVPLPPMVRLLDPEHHLIGIAKPGKTPGNLHSWVVLA